jgi:hypothetical protein
VARGSAKYIKLKIYAIEIEREGLRIDQEELMLEYKEKRPDGGHFDKACRGINERISSLGVDLRQSKQELRSLEEKTGKISLLTIDSKTLFAATLLRLYKDPFTKNRSSTEQSTMRRESIQVYNPRKTENRYDVLRCTLLDEHLPADEIVTAHIVPARLGPELVDYIFGEGMGVGSSGPRIVSLCIKYLNKHLIMRTSYLYRLTERKLRSGDRRLLSLIEVRGTSP